MSICLEPGVVPSNSKGRCQSSPRPRACGHATIRVPNASRGRAAPGGRSINIRMWSPRTFRRILAFEISLCPNLNFILESRVILDIPCGGLVSCRKECGTCGRQGISTTIITINQRNIPKARRRSPDSERHSVNDPHQRSVGQRSLTLPYLHYTPSEHYRSRISEQCPAKTRRRRIRISLSGS